MSVTPIDAELLAEQAEELSDTIEALDNERSPLWAVYGYNGTWEAERKALLCVCADLVRHGYQVKQLKVTEAQIDQEAHATDTYNNRIGQAVDERTKMALLDAEIASKTRRYELAKERMANYRKASV